METSSASAVQKVAERVEAHVRRHAMFSSGERVVVACSGGVDSTCLLHLLTQGLASLDLSCVAVYVDHRLRPDGRAERAWVERLAASLGAEFASVEVDVATTVKERGGSIQETARALRYDALSRIARARGAARIAVGHTRTDQAETLLLQLLRGTGLRGLAGMRAVRGAIVRPLLTLSRSDVEAYCRALGLEWLEDPSNQSDRYARNRVRRDVFPLLKAIQPRAEERLATTAHIVEDEDRYMEEQVDAVFDRVAQPLAWSRGGWRLVGAELRALPKAIARRVVRRAAAQLEAGSAGGVVLDFKEVEAVLAAAEQGRGGGRQLALRGALALHEYGDVCLLPKDAEAALFSARPAEAVPLLTPGTTPIPWANAVLETSFHDREALDLGRDAGVAWMDWERVEPPLVVRGRGEGDRVQPLGMAGRKRVKDILIDAKVPRRLRATVPIVWDRRGIVWVVGHCLSERVKVTDESRRLLRVAARQSGDKRL